MDSLQENDVLVAATNNSFSGFWGELLTTVALKRGATGGNDAGAWQRSAEGKKTCVLSVPCRYIHGPSSVMKLSDMEDQFALAQAFARQAK